MKHDVSPVVDAPHLTYQAIGRQVPYLPEMWLADAVTLISPIFEEAGHIVPPVVVSIGFGTDGFDERRKRNTLAQCLARSWSIDGVNSIFIAPFYFPDLRVLSLLTHELVHAVDDCKHGHGPEFRSIARSVGLVQCREDNECCGQVLTRKLTAIGKVLGRYPRPGLAGYLAEQFCAR